MSRVRMTAAQFALFDRPAASRAPSGPRTRRPKDQLPENIVEGQITGFLRARGWTVTRQQSGTFIPAWVLHDPAKAHMLLDEKRRGSLFVRVGEKGVADWRAERVCNMDEVARKQDLDSRCLSHWLFYFEVKAPGKKPSEHQAAWLHARRSTGTAAEWFDDFDSFRQWYKERFQ